MSHSNTKKGLKSAKSPTEAEQDEDAYSKIRENAKKRNELLRLRKEAEKSKKEPRGSPGNIGNVYRSGSQCTSSRRCENASIPDMLKTFFNEKKDVVGMSTEVKPDGTMTHKFHFKRQPSSNVKEIGDDEDESDDSSDSDSGPSPSETSSDSCGPDEVSLAEFLNQLSSVLKEKGCSSSTSPKYKFTCSVPKGCQTSPITTPAPSTPVKKPAAAAPAPAPKAETPVVKAAPFVQKP